VEQLGWMWSAAGSRVSRSASQGSDSRSSTIDGCGQSSLESCASLSREPSSSRTCQDCGRPDCVTCWPTLPISGSMRSGRVSQQEKIRSAPTDGRTPEPLTSDDGSFSLLPTPTAQRYGSNRGGSAGRAGKERSSLDTLARRGLLPTPAVKGNRNRAGLTARSGDGLATAVGGTLHPRFVEWMMGLPRDWTVPATMTSEEIEAKRAMLRKKAKPRTRGE
jgi:hypothetical protein